MLQLVLFYACIIPLRYIKHNPNHLCLASTKKRKEWKLLVVDHLVRISRDTVVRLEHTIRVRTSCGRAMDGSYSW